MAGPLTTVDWLIIMVLVIVAIFLIYLFSPLIILILMIAGGISNLQVV